MSWDELTKSLEGYWFFKGIEGLEDDLSRVEIQFDKAWMQEVAKRASNYPLSILPVLQYMVLKKIEVDNLRTLGWGKWQNIPKEEIESQLVIL
jgi:V/A-type H+-transporting ATPase subunit C